MTETLQAQRAARKAEMAGKKPKTLNIPLQKLHEAATIPTYARQSDAGVDLTATEDVRIEPGRRAMVPTGIAMAIPEGYVGLIHPRSGLAAKHGITVLNAPGTIDAGYRGEFKVILLNTDLDSAVEFKVGDRIAQLVIQPVSQASFEITDSLEASERGEGGFGSTGTGS